MSKTYRAKENKSSWLNKQWYGWVEVFLIRTVLPIAIIYLVRNSIKYFKERGVIKRTLLSSQELVDALDIGGFYLDIKDFYLFKFTTYALDNIQILTEKVTSVQNMHHETMTRLIISNVNDILKGKGEGILNNTSMRILKPSDTVLLIRLHPKSMKSVVVSSIDLCWNIAITLSIIGLVMVLNYYFNIF